MDDLLWSCVFVISSAVPPPCRPVGIFVYLIYLFFVVVVLLSLLVAQMSDTFANIQSDADRVSIWIRAKTILTQERSGMFGVVSKCVLVATKNIINIACFSDTEF